MKRMLATTAFVASLTLSGMAMAGQFLTPPQIQNFSFSLLDESTTLAFNGFDSSLGTLTSVHLKWTLDKTLENIVINSNVGDSDIGNPTAISATSTTTFQVLGVSGALALTSVNTLTTPGFTGIVPGTGGSSAFTTTTVGTAADANLSGAAWICSDDSCLNLPGATNVQDLSFFLSAISVFDVSVENRGSQGGSVAAGVFTGNAGTATGTVSIVYDYDTVQAETVGGTAPEPATVALLGLGISLIGLQGTFRKRKQISVKCRERGSL